MKANNLSELQKEIILLMRQGWEFYSSKSEHYGRKRQLVYSARLYWIENDNGTSKPVSSSTFRSLAERGLMDRHRPYNLTELGKTCEI